MSTTKELLSELAMLDSVEVVAVGDADHVAEVVPEWCEIVLNLERDGAVRSVPLTRADGELIIEALYEVLHPNTHRSSPVTRIWEHLDELIDFLMSDDDPEPEDKAAARAYATALAYLTKPNSADDDVEQNINDIRAIAVERWQERS